jgi:hypothetical protein
MLSRDHKLYCIIIMSFICLCFGCCNWAVHAGLSYVRSNCISVYYWPVNDKKFVRLLRVLLINLYFNDEILTCLSFVSIWNIALRWVYNIYIILLYSVWHFVVLYYTKFVCMYSNVILCYVWYCVCPIWHDCCAIIYYYNDMFHILSCWSTWWIYEMYVM